MAENKVENNKFLTTQTPLAAWLHSQGFKIIEVLTLEFPAAIVFEDSPSLQKYIRLWQTNGDNCNAFYNSYRQILDKIKPSWIWRGK